MRSRKSTYYRAGKGLSRFQLEWRWVDRSAGLHDKFDLPMQWQHHIASPYPYRNDARSDEEIIAQGVANLKAKVAELGVENVAAFIMELVQGSGGVIVPLKATPKRCRTPVANLASCSLWMR